MPAHSIPLAERFRMYVEKTPTCWVWTANRPDGRYGHLKFKGRTYLAHRVAYELFVGPIPAGSWVLHHCDNPAGTASQNVLDKIYKRRGGFGEIHGRAKVTDDDAREIRRVMSAPGPKRGRRKALAAKYGLSVTSVSRIASGAQFVHLGADRQ